MRSRSAPSGPSGSSVTDGGPTYVPDLRARVGRVRRRLRCQRAGHMGLTVAAVAAVWLLALLVMDVGLQPSRGPRLALLAAATGLAAAWSRRHHHRLSASMEEAAERIEQKQPALRGTVLTAWELDQALAAGLDVGSPEIARSFLRRAEQHAARIDPAEAAPYGELWRQAAKTLPLVLVALLALGADPGRTATFLKRLFALSGQPYPPRTVVLQVQPGTTAWIEGRPVTFSAEARGVIPDSGRLKLHYADGSAQSVRLGKKGNRFTSSPIVLEQSADYHVEIGPAVSPTYSLRLIRYPRLRIEISGRPPAYSGRPEQRVPGKEASFLQGSSVRLVVQGSKDLDAVQIRTEGQSLAVHRIGPRRYEAAWTLEADTTLEVKAVDADRLATTETIHLKAQPDSPPVAVLNDGEPEMPVQPRAEIRLPYHAADDLGVADLKIFQASAPGRTAQVPDQPAGARGDRLLVALPLAGQPHAGGHLPLELDDLLKKPGDRLVVYAEATDTSPAGQSARSDPVTIRVMDPIEARQIHQAWADDLEDRLEAIERTAARARFDTASGPWDEASEAQDQCTQELAAVEEHLKQSSPPLDEQQRAGTRARELARLAESIQAAREASQAAGRQLRQMVQPSGKGRGKGPQGLPDGLADLQQTMARRLREARALADPAGTSAPVRDRVADFVRACGELAPMPDDLATRPHQAEGRVDFWSERKRDLAALQRDIRAADEQGITAAAPWIQEVGQFLNDTKLAQDIDQTHRALQALDTSKARDLEEKIGQNVQQLGAMLPQPPGPPAARPGQGGRGRPREMATSRSEPEAEDQASAKGRSPQAGPPASSGSPAAQSGGSTPGEARPGRPSGAGSPHRGSQSPAARSLAQRLQQMATFQEDCCRAGKTAGSETEARRQEALARRARAVARQMVRGEGASQIEQAAAAAEAAARAIRQGDSAGAQTAQALSAQSLRGALQALGTTQHRTSRPAGPANRPAAAGAGWQVGLPPELRQRVSAFFDRPAPRRYSDQLRAYITRFPWKEQRPDDSPPPEETND